MDRIALTPGISEKQEASTRPGDPPTHHYQTRANKHHQQDLEDLDQAIPNQAIIAALIKAQYNQIQKLLQLSSAVLEAPTDLAPQLINAASPSINAPLNEVAEYLRELSYKIYNSSAGQVPLYTQEEAAYWDKFSPFERNTLITGEPLHPPEWRRNLVAFSEPDEIPLLEEDHQEEPLPLPTQPTGSTTPQPRVALDLNNNPPSKGPRSFTRGCRSIGKGIMNRLGRKSRKNDPTSQFYLPVI